MSILAFDKVLLKVTTLLIMRFSVLLVSVVVSSSGAFQPATHGRRGRILPRLEGTVRPDSSEAVAEALRISKKYGASSPEARVAWDVVEEMDSNWTPNMEDMSSSKSLSKEEMNKMDYGIQVRALAQLLQGNKETLNQIKTLAANIKQMELTDPSLSKLPSEASKLKTVLSEAKAAAEVNGPNSPEAIKAWDAVEGCVESVNGDECNVESMYRYSAAALKAHHYYDAVIDSEFLQEAVDAVETLDSFRRFVQVERNRLDNQDGSISP